MPYACKYLKAGAVLQMSYKLVSIGDASTGKTSLLARFGQNTFDEHQSSTIGVEFSTVEHSGVKMTLWDEHIHAVKDGDDTCPVIAIRSAKVGDFGGRSVSTTRSSMVSRLLYVCVV